jgi:hypothetical protein
MLYKSFYVDTIQTVNESDKEYSMRKWFIAKNLNVHKSIDSVTLDLLSNHYIKKTIYGCTYGDEITKLLEVCESNLYE